MGETLLDHAGPYPEDSGIPAGAAAVAEPAVTVGVMAVTVGVASTGGGRGNGGFFHPPSFSTFLRSLDQS